VRSFAQLMKEVRFPYIRTVFIPKFVAMMRHSIVYLGSRGTNYAIANEKLVEEGIASFGGPPIGAIICGQFYRRWGFEYPPSGPRFVFGDI
jgi:hypothetical protein